jgi:hypothetical protein
MIEWERQSIIGSPLYNLKYATANHGFSFAIFQLLTAGTSCLKSPLASVNNI